MTLLDAAGTVALERGTLTVALTVHPGEVVGLVGPNGAGKSATLRTLLGLQRLTAGAISLGRRVVDDGSRAAPPATRGLGWVPQSPALLPRRRLTAQLAPFRSDHAPSARHGLDALLVELGLEVRRGRRPHELSGGEAQRVAVARALLAARCVLLDEPTSAQDAAGAAAVRRAVRRHTADGGGAVVVAHRPEDAYAFADRLIVLDAGEVVQTGTAAELAARPTTAYVAHVVGATVLEGEVDEQGVLHGPWGRLTVPDGTPAGRAVAAIRPGAVVVHRRQPTGSPRNVVSGVVSGLEDTPSGVTVRVDGSPSLVATLTHAAADELGLRRGDQVWAAVKANDITITPTA